MHAFIDNVYILMKKAFWGIFIEPYKCYQFVVVISSVFGCKLMYVILVKGFKSSPVKYDEGSLEWYSLPTYFPLLRYDHHYNGLWSFCKNCSERLIFL